MFKTFFSVTLYSVILLWYLSNFHTETFYSLLQSVPLLTKFIQPATPSEKVFTREELERYNGKHGSSGIYLAILGHVFDVRKGKKHYGPGGAYHFFAGKDATRSFITGHFEGTPRDDILDLSSDELLSLKRWLDFFKKEYKYKGRLIGRYYNDMGDWTDYQKDFNSRLNKALNEKKAEAADKVNFPPCNVEWTQETGSRVWCTNKSGGIARDYVGVPRKLYEVGSDKFHCACIDLQKLEDPNSVQYAKRGLLQQYKDCDPLASSCAVIK